MRSFILQVRLLCLLALAFASALVGTAAHAAFVSPDNASWGGWSRGDAGTLYTHFDNMGIDGTYVGSSSVAADVSADVGTHNASQSGIALFKASTTTVTSTRNFYNFYIRGHYRSYAVADTAMSGKLRAALQIKTLGNPLDPNSVSLSDGNSVFAYQSVSSVLNADNSTDWLFLFALDSDLGTYEFDYRASAAHMSLAEVAIDIGPAPVPVPASVWLFASAVAGLCGLRRVKV